MEPEALNGTLKGVTLAEFAGTKKRELFDLIQKNQLPTEVEWDAALLKEAQTKGEPQMGATVYHPNALVFEFIYGTGQSGTMVVEVKLAAPERIVYLPVPKWVVENIWQGEVSGSYHFESQAQLLLAELHDQVQPAPNAALFAPKPPTRRE